MKYCINCGKEIPEEAMFCHLCGTRQESEEQKEVATAKEPEDHTFLIVWSSILAISIVGVLLWMFVIPLDNDKECYQAGKEAHEALHKLNWYGHNYECSDGCPICYPLTWRWHIKKVRMGW